jgi:riboflavin biosynthesis pyrimidine reductase
MLVPLQTLLERAPGRAIRLPRRLAALYGRLCLPPAQRRPYVFSNFVSTLDGVVSLGVRGHLGGADISGHNAMDRMVMGLLRAVADVVLIGAGTLNADRRHLWTPEGICPELAAEFHALRDALRKPPTPLTVIVSGSGKLNGSLPVFASAGARAVVLTTSAGARELARRQRLAPAAVRAIPTTGPTLSPAVILRAIRQLEAGNHVLLEGGPRLLGEFYARHLVDEQFLTLSPQLVGRSRGDRRLSLVMEQRFAPGSGRWARLIGVKRSADHLFLRYQMI